MAQTETLSDDSRQFDTRSFDESNTRSDDMQAALASWVEGLAEQTDETLRDRLDRIASTAAELIETIERV